MANTFKFGNGNWAVGKETVLAYNDENNNFKPLPFDFTRDSIGTYVDSDGLIKTAGQGEPRIDYLDNADGHLLLEPARANLFTYSEQFDNAIWGAPSNVIANTTNAPDGNTTADTLNGLLQRLQVLSPIQYVFSFYAKKNTSSTFSMRVDAPTNQTFDFNLDTEVATSPATMINVGNGWYRCLIPFTSSLDGTAVFYPNVNNDNLYIWGAQLEAASYATSYIPTEGSSVTRVDESLVQDKMPTSLFNKNGMAFYLELEALANDNESRSITISDDSSSDRFVFQLNSSNEFSVFTISNLGVTDFSIATLGGDITQKSKVAASFDGSNGYLYVNGTQIGVDSISFVIGDNLDKISFGNHSLTSNPFYGKITDYRIYNNALTTSELETLTSN